MPTVTLTVDEAGKLHGVTERDEKNYLKFRARLVDMTPEDSVLFTWKEPRSGPYHKRHFVMIGALFAAQDQFEDQEQFRKWLEVGGGYCKYVPGPKGKMVALPDSIAYEKLDQADFEPIHEATFRFARTAHATRFLWPHLSDQQQMDMVQAVLGEFD